MRTLNGQKYRLSDDVLLAATALTEDELDGVTGGRVLVGVPSGAMTAMMCWGPGTGLLVWATAGGHGFVVGT